MLSLVCAGAAFTAPTLAGLHAKRAQSPIVMKWGEHLSPESIGVPGADRSMLTQVTDPDLACAALGMWHAID